ncbi:DUF3511 domain protein [Hordeum vulgare]|nr:DUF3511 domain protein [Hordeum vulgare]
MAAADYDRAYRPYAPSSAGDYDRPYRNEIVPYGDRRIDLVVKPPPPTRSPPPPLPVTKSGGGGGIGSAWCFSDPEVKRRRRVASYKAYSVEGKVKASFRRGFRWIKDKCTGFIHGCGMRWLLGHGTHKMRHVAYAGWLLTAAALIVGNLALLFRGRYLFILDGSFVVVTGDSSDLK